MEDVVPNSTARERASQIRTVWFPFLGAPVAWALCFLAIYIFAQWACSAGFAETEVVGVTLVNFVDFLLILAAAGVTVYAGLVGHREWRAAGGEEQSTHGWTEGRQRFVGLFGVIAAALFLAGLVFQAIPVLVLPPCLF
jgi:amino acid permease